jgi:hypothetical protein
MFRVWRFNPKTEEIMLCSEQKVTGRCRSNFTTGSLAGCLLSDKEQDQLYFVDWKKGTEGLFTISYPGKVSCNIMPKLRL